MNGQVNTGEKENLGYFNIIIIVLSVLVLGVLVVDTFYDLPDETSRLLNYFDFAICIVFFVEFILGFYKAESKLRYMVGAG